MRSFATTTAGSDVERSFMLKYTYVDDAYYKRIPHREAHEEHISKFIKSNQTDILAAPFFPYSGSVFFIEKQEVVEGENMRSTIEQFVKSDPYFQKNLIKSYELRPVAMTHKKRDFDRLAEEYLIRS